MKIAYIGIDFLSAALDALLQAGCEIMEIYTCRTDNKTEFNTYIRTVAERLEVPCYFKRIHREDIIRLKEEGCEAVVCAGCYYKIPVCGELPMVNVHPSYLPLGRGAWPMPVAILKGLSESGVTIHKLTEELDMGDILLQDKFSLDKEENLESFMEKANGVIHRLIPELLEHFDELYRKAKPQGEGEYWLNPEEKDWTLSPDMEDQTIDRVLRAFYGYECIWEENGQRFELIYGKLVSKPPAEGRYFMTAGGSFVTAKQVEELPDETMEPWQTVGEDGKQSKKLCCMGMPKLIHRKQMEQLRQKYKQELSSHAFVSLFLWRKAMQLTLYMSEEMFTLRCGWTGRNTWFFPCGAPEAVLEFINSHINEADFSLCYLRKQDVKLLQEAFPGKFEFIRAEASDEYIYERKGHADLVGKLYANVRTQLHKVQREHELKVEKITEINAAMVDRILSEWKNSRPLSRRKHPLKTTAIENAFFSITGNEEQEALENLADLEITGILVYMDGEPYAVVAGFALTEDTYDVFLAKEKGRAQGLGYYSKREFFMSLPNQYRYLNIEEDMGIEGLRKMKKLLVPVRMNEIWEVVRCKTTKEKICLQEECSEDCGEHL